MYHIREITLKNNTLQKKRLIIEFDEQEKMIVAEFLMSDATLLNNAILKEIDEVLSGEQKKIESSFNRCSLEITKKITTFNDLFEDILGLDALIEYKMSTIELRNLIKKWFYEIDAFNKRQA